MAKLGVILLCLLALPAFAGGREKSLFVDLGKPVFVRYQPAEENAPTLVLLNGLTYSTDQWSLFTASLNRLDPRLGILRYDMKGMGKTLLADHLPVNYGISYQDQVDLLEKLLNKMNLDRVVLLGLSYGGGIALPFAARHPERVASLILMAPFTEALQAQDQWIRAEVAANRMAFPYNPATDDELYDYFLRQFIYTTYPTAEPVVLENPYILEAVFRMVQGIRLFRADSVVNQIAAPVHLMVASQDQYIPQEVLERFWNALPREIRASRLKISYTEHKIPEAVPGFAAAWVQEILRNPLLREGKTFQGQTWDYTAHWGKKAIHLTRP
jgi:pimeloyl-ACP methyl ester carboxylesterase